jgi:hypothetical protein
LGKCCCRIGWRWRVGVGVEVEASDRGTVLCLVRIDLAVVEVGGEWRNDAHSIHCLVRTVPVVVAVATVVEVETVMMTDTHTVPYLAHNVLVLVAAVAVAVVVEIERGVIGTTATNDIHTVHCSVHTALALVRADAHPYKRSHVADSFGARS